MNIPVFHDDQHGTAIVAAAALMEEQMGLSGHVPIAPKSPDG